MAKTAKMELLDHTETPAQLANPDHRVLVDSLDLPVSPEPKVTEASVATPEKTESLVKMVILVPKVLKVIKVLPVLPDHQANKVHEDIPVSPEKPVHVVQLVCTENLVHLDQWELLVHLASPVIPDPRENPVLLVTKVHKVHKVPVVKMVSPAHPVQLVFLELLVWTELQAQKVQPVMLVQLALQVFQVLVAHLVLKVTWVHPVSRVTKVSPVPLASKVTKVQRENKVKWV